MHTIVCIKQVPAVGQVRFNPNTNNLDRDGVDSIINPPDRHAIEAAVQLKKACGGSISVLTMGPPQAQAALRQALAMGCDNAYLICDKAFAGSDTLATSYTLAAAIDKIGDFDLIICGSQAIDADTGQVGPQLAERLDLPQITYVCKIYVETEHRSVSTSQKSKQFIKATQQLDCGLRTVQANLPALITVVPDINKPHIPNAIAIMQAARQPIITWSNTDLHLDKKRIGSTGSPTQVTRLYCREKNKQVQMIEGPPQQMVDRLLTIMHDRHFV